MLNLDELIALGFLNDGDEIYWKQPILKVTHTAIIKRGGTVLTSDGITHRSLSGAARHFYKKPIDGWHNWRLVSTCERLSEVRDKAIHK